MCGRLMNLRLNYLRFKLTHENLLTSPNKAVVLKVGGRTSILLPSPPSLSFRGQTYIYPLALVMHAPPLPRHRFALFFPMALFLTDVPHVPHHIYHGFVSAYLRSPCFFIKRLFGSPRIFRSLFELKQLPIWLGVRLTVVEDPSFEVFFRCNEVIYVCLDWFLW